MNPKLSLFTNYAHVLAALLHNPDARQRDIASQVGITEGAVQRLLQDLTDSGYVTKTRIGRRNHYVINPTCQLRHPINTNLALTPLLALFSRTADTIGSTSPAAETAA